jgi:hypothetical protein
LPFSALTFLPNLMRFEVLADSSCASAPKMVSTNSLFPSTVMLAVRKVVSMPSAFSARMDCRKSTVLRAKREMSLTTTISKSPRCASCISRWNSLRFLIFVPEIPSSAYTRTSVSPVRWTYSEKNFFCVSSELSWSDLSVETRQYAAMFMEFSLPCVLVLLMPVSHTLRQKSTLKLFCVLLLLI